MYNALSHDGYICAILDSIHHLPLGLDDNALHGNYVLMLSPLDCDPDSDEHLVCGTVFSIYKRRSSPSVRGRLADLQQAVDHQVAAGYVVYSSSTRLCFTMRHGAFFFALHPVASQYFMELDAPFKISHLSNPQCHVYVDLNVINQRRECKLSIALRTFVKDNRAAVYSHGCATSDFDAALRSGALIVLFGIHLLCEAAPLALIAEQMRGKAIDAQGRRLLGTQNILNFFKRQNPVSRSSHLRDVIIC